MQKFVYPFLLSWMIFLAALMAVGAYSKANIGAITWGPTTDITAMSIAISELEFGLHGGIGYRGVSQQLAKYLTIQGNERDVMERGTRLLVKDPSIVTHAIRAAAQTPQTQIHDGVMNYDNYVTTYAEDIGFAHFYELAFKLFGYHSLSTHYLYFTLLLFSLGIFVLGFFRDEKSLVILTLAMTSLYLLASGFEFSDSVPTFTSNRFLSTLVIIPGLYLLLFITKETTLKKIEIICLLLQLILLAFTINLRSSAYWVSIAITLLGTILFVYRYKQKCLMGCKRIVIGLVSMAVLLLGYNAFVKFSLNDVYKTDDIIPYHMRWHSAYIGLALHPNWQQNLAYPELADQANDGIPFTISKIYQQQDPEHYPLSVVTRSYPIKVHEKIIKQEFFKFAYHHPWYMITLIGYYKPLLLMQLLCKLLQSIPLIPWVLAFIGIIAASLVKASFKEAYVFAGILSVFWGVSLLPLMMTYPASWVMCDQAWSTLLLLTLGAWMIIKFLLKTFVKRNLVS